MTRKELKCNNSNSNKKKKKKKTNNNDDDDDDDNPIERRNSRFYYFLTAPRTVSNTYALVPRVQSCASHVQHIERLSRATCRVPLGMKGQLSY